MIIIDVDYALGCLCCVVVDSVADISELYTTAIFMVKVSRFLFRQNCGGKVWVHAHSSSLGAADRKKLVVKWPICRAIEFSKKTSDVGVPMR